MKIGSKVKVVYVDDFDKSCGVAAGMIGTIVENVPHQSANNFIGEMVVVRLDEISDDYPHSLYIKQLEVIK